MVRKPGRAKAMRRTFVKVMAATGDQTYAAHKAGYSNPETDGSRLMAKQAIKESVMDAQLQRIRTEGVIVATDALIEIAGDRTLPPGARTQAAKQLWDVSLKDRENSGGAKELHEMSAGELQADIRRLEMLTAIAKREALERDGEDVDEAEVVPVIEAEPADEGDVFG